MKGKVVLLLLTCLIITTALVLTSCGNPAVDVVKKFIEAEDLMFSTGDGSGLMAIEDPDIVIHMMGWPDTIGSANHVAAIQGIVAGNPGITHDWSEITGSGDIGAVRWVEHVNIGGTPVSYQGAYFLKIRDGKIVEAWLISDMLTYFLAAGIVQYVPAP